MCGIAVIGIRGAAGNIALIGLISGLVRAAHLTAQEQRKPDQERDGHDQRRSQRLQIGEHPGGLLFRSAVPLLALLLTTAGSRTPAPARTVLNADRNKPGRGTDRFRAYQ